MTMFPLLTSWIDDRSQTFVKNPQQIDPNAGGSPFNAVTAAVPGLIEAEEFDEGGLDVAYFDTTGGNDGNVGGSVALPSKAGAGS